MDRTYLLCWIGQNGEVDGESVVDNSQDFAIRMDA